MPELEWDGTADNSGIELRSRAVVRFLPDPFLEPVRNSSAPIFLTGQRFAWFSASASLPFSLLVE